MLFRHLLAPLHASAAGGDLDREVTLVSRDTRAVRQPDGSWRPGALLVAIAGERFDTHDHLGDLPAGALVVIERDVPVPPGVAWMRVDDTRRALAWAAAEVAGRPAEVVPVIGITGTNGKTTVATLIQQAVEGAGGIAGRIGTTGVSVGAERIPSDLTTPEAPVLQSWIRRMVDAGASVVAMEVSSIGLVQQRVEALPFAVGVFTNLSHDHLDFHGTMAAYVEAKARLFRDHLRPAGGAPRALLFADDPAWRMMAPPADRWTYGMAADADLHIEAADLRPDGMTVALRWPGGRVSLEAPLLGRHNAYNLVGAFGAAVLAGQDSASLVAGFRTATGAPGRLQPVPNDRGLVVLVDYAHTPDALVAAIASVRASARGRVWVVFGCGGDRDRAKRPEMGRAALAADVAVLTSDNPRSEDPGAILEDVLAGLSDRRAVVVEPDREAAIRLAVDGARPGDAVLIAGKGHETWQEIAGVKHPFDDVAVARRVMEGR